MSSYPFLAYASPFKTFEEFSAAEGPIYTYAQAPGFIAFLIILTALIMLYFIYATFVIKGGEFTSDAKSPAVLSILLILGMASLADRVYTTIRKPSDRPVAGVVSRGQTPSSTTPTSPLKPLALLGMVGAGTTAFHQTNRLRTKHQRPKPGVRRRRSH